MYSQPDQLTRADLALCAGTLRATYNASKAANGFGFAQAAAIMAMRTLRLPPGALDVLLNDILQQPRCSIVHALHVALVGLASAPANWRCALALQDNNNEPPGMLMARAGG